MVKSREFVYAIEATLANGAECRSYEKDINTAMLQAACMAKSGSVVHRVKAIVTTVEEHVVVDYDQWRESD